MEETILKEPSHLQISNYLMVLIGSKQKPIFAVAYGIVSWAMIALGNENDYRFSSQYLGT